MSKTCQWIGLVGTALGILIGSSSQSLAQEISPEQALAQETQNALVAGSRSDYPASYADPYDPYFYTESLPPTIPQRFNQAFYSHTGNYFDNRGIWQGFRLIFGIPNYVENSISQDGRAVNRLYKEVLEQQLTSDPILRTPDLPNPYTGSVLTTPLVITEEPISPLEPFPSIRRPSVVEPAPAAPGDAGTPSQRQSSPQPVPALW